MSNIIVIETKDDSGLFQELMKVITKNEERQCTYIRVGLTESDEKLLLFPGLSIDMERYMVMENGEPISLNAFEFQALAYLVRKPGRIFTKEQIYNEVYGEEKIVNVENAVYCLIRDIRKKLGKNQKSHKYIQTVWGIGYKFVVPEE